MEIVVSYYFVNVYYFVCMYVCMYVYTRIYMHTHVSTFYVPTHVCSEYNMCTRIRFSFSILIRNQIIHDFIAPVDVGV